MRASPSECPPPRGSSRARPSRSVSQPPHSLSSPRSGGWHTSSLSSALPGSLLTPELPPPPMDGPPVSQDPSPVPPVIKAGWLDKNPPQG